MVTKNRPLPCPKAFTIIESIVVLAILVVFTMVALALYNYETNPDRPKDKTTGASHSGSAGNVSREPSPVEADGGEEK